MRSKFFIQFVINLVLLLSFESLTAQDWLWPTNSSRLLTSSFAEVRPRRYHAGWDVKTWGKEGYPIYAMKNGYIWRVRVSPFGYGKVVYVKHYNGYYSVYAHLSGFYKPLEDLIRKKQLETNEFIQQFYFKPGEFPVKKGQIIAKSGSTGIGYPHLHFEIRNKKHEPINPVYFFNNEVQDNFHPVVKSVAFIPHSFNTYINYQGSPLLFNEFIKKNNSYYLKNSPLITGPFSISIYAFDRMQKGMNRIFYQKAELFVNDTLISQLEYDTLLYLYNHHVDLERNYYLKRQGMKRFQDFYYNSHFKLPFFKQIKNNGLISDLEDGLHNFVIKIYDIKGNITSVYGQFIYSRGNPGVAVVQKNNDSTYLKITPSFPTSRVNISHFFKKSPLYKEKSFEVKQENKFDESLFIYLSNKELESYVGSQISLYPSNSKKSVSTIYLRDNIKKEYLKNIYLDEVIEMPDWYNFKFKGEELMPPPANLFSLNFNFQAKWLQKSTSSGILAVHKEIFANNKTIKVYWKGDSLRLFSLDYPQIKVMANEEKTVFSEDSIFKVKIYASTLYDSLYINIKRHLPEKFSDNEEVPLLTHVYKVESQAIPFKNVVKIGFNSSNLLNNKGVFPAYFDQQKEGWYFLPHELSKDSLWIIADVLSMEYFAMAQDSVLPIIEPINFHNNESISIKSLKLKIKDEFSGIFKMEQIKVTVNDYKQIFEYDPEMDYILIPGWSLKSGEIKLGIKVEDNAGNVAKKYYYLELR